MKRKFTLITMVLCACFMTAQTVEQKAKIIEANNQKELQQLIFDLDSKNVKDQEAVLEYTRTNNIPLFRKNQNGSFDQLMRISDTGIPIYYSIDNVDAANSTRANRLHNNGSLGLNIEGQGMTAHVWDGGPVRTSHQEFTTASPSRAVVGDGVIALNGNSFHATHVSGTIVASGVDPLAKGMAPQADVVTYNWSNDYSEMTRAAANGALISNHSYGVPARSFAGSPQFIGKYGSDARTVDQITYNAPYYLPVFSAGNEGADDTSNGSPLGSNSSFDKLTGDKLAKNIMTVANAQDAVILNDGSLIFVQINPSSSEGPSDDFRIKPDITGNGTGVYSTFDGSNSDYSSISGTSMAAPNVAGSLLLLQQYYSEKNGALMRAATLKGLACHTSDDAGLAGPDAVFGWGVMNTMAAANAITNDKLTSRIVERELAQGETYSFTVESDNVSTLMASLSWTDVAGQINNNGANDGTPSLVNDLDLRISQGSTVFEPWKLDGVNSNTKGDNVVDNFELVPVENASGVYTITVTHKGTLADGPQKFSIVVTGESNEYAVLSSETNVVACSDQSAAIPLSFIATPAFNRTAVLTVDGLPSGVTANFSNSSFTSPGSSVLTIGNLNGVASGFYDLTVEATAGSEVKSLNVRLRVIRNSFDPVVAVFPTDQLTGVNTSNLILQWNLDPNGQNYEVELSSDNTFTSTIVSETTSTNSFSVDANLLNSNVTYFWRVRPVNNCGQGTYGVYSFTSLVCTDFNNLLTAPVFINDANAAGVTRTVMVNETDNIVIGRLTVDFLSNHQYSGDLRIALTSPAGTTVVLAEPNQCPTPNLDVTFDDEASPYFCNVTGQPGYIGVVSPIGSLSAFNGETINGTWSLNVSDRGAGDIGTFDNWGITFCETPAILSNEEIEQVDFAIYPNPSKGIFTVTSSNDLDGDATINVVDLNGRVVFTKDIQNASRLNESIDVQNLTSGLYLLQIQNGSSRTVKKIIIQ